MRLNQFLSNVYDLQAWHGDILLTKQLRKFKIINQEIFEMVFGANLVAE